MNIDDLLIGFDEMGFAPTNLRENPEEYSREWKRQLVVEIEKLKEENKLLSRTDDERCQEIEDNIRAEIANSGTSCHWCEDIIRKKAVKEFAEKLERICLQRGEWDEDCEGMNPEYFNIGRLCIKDIDKLLKEYEK